MSLPVVLVIGAGPAGLTAAHELAVAGRYRPIVLEASPRVGGLAATVRHGGHRIDIGGHRFFTKSDRVLAWWLAMLPLERAADTAWMLSYQGARRALTSNVDGPDPATTDEVMLVRRRKSRIYHRGQFFDYPLSLSPATVLKLGLARTAWVGASYLRAQLFPRRPEDTLEAFLVNRFGRALYASFFRDYTEKVWGRSCRDISAEWGRQRIKGLSIAKAIATAVRKRLGHPGPVETSLIEHFLYPKLGPGQMWETCARAVTRMGGEVQTGARVVGIAVERGVVRAVTVVRADGTRQELAGDWVISTMPIRDLVESLDGVALSDDERGIARGLEYRDFLTVGLLVDRFGRGPGRLDDCWIYVQEPGVRVGRIQLFNNWSPWMVDDPDRDWIGLEYFLDETDRMWAASDAELVGLATAELGTLGLVDAGTVRDATVLRVRKAYPGYFGTYDRLGTLRDALDERVANLVLVGRNGMHRYNNQDHSMLAAMTAVDQIHAGRVDKRAIWAVNTDDTYHEERA